MVAELEALLAKESVSEHSLQLFFEGHTELFEAIGSYTNVMSQVILENDAGTTLIPDFVLELPGDRGSEILDLKLPTAQIVARDPRARLAQSVSKAVAQLREYREYFSQATNRDRFRVKYGLEVFRPTLSVVIGRSTDFSSVLERRELEEQAGALRLLTYDDILAYAKARMIPRRRTAMK